jgi:menaquinone-9 beta-reductase
MSLPKGTRKYPDIDGCFRPGGDGSNTNQSFPNDSVSRLSASLDLPRRLDVFVIGGGPAGLATAIAARQRGLTVAVVDAATPPIDKPCGEGLMPDGIEALRNLGVTIPREAVYPFRGIRFVSGAHRPAAVFSHGPACGIRRTILHQLLIDHAAACGVSLFWQTPVRGITSECVLVDNQPVQARFIVGADGTNSRVRRWAGLDRHTRQDVRFGFRRHYHIAPWTDFMELHWGNRAEVNDCQTRGCQPNGSQINDCQIYVTPVGENDVCLALVSSNPHLRLDAALASFPELATRLAGALHASVERGAITVGRKLRRVCRDRIALVGDASGGVDAITGEGLCLAFRQAALLADCFASGNLANYQLEHRRLLRRPALMAQLMLLIAKHPRLRQRTMQVFESHPQSFAGMLAMHMGSALPRDYVANGISLGYRLLRA